MLAHAASKGQPLDTVRSPFRMADGTVLVKLAGGGGWVPADTDVPDRWGPEPEP